MTGDRRISLHPVFLVALAVLIVNDHVLKDAHPSWWTGKLSDVAGLVLAPFFLAAVHQAVTRRAPSHILLIASALLVAIAFTLVKVFPWGEAVYETGLAVLQWPFLAIGAALQGVGIPDLAQVDLVRDKTDLLAIPFAFVGWLILRSWQTDHQS